MSKKYYWNWASDDFMDEDINQFLEVSKKKNNEWWKNLNITPFYKTHIGYFREIAKQYFNSNHVSDVQSTATVKTCPAIGNGLLDKTILVKLPCDVMLSVNENGSVYWQIKSPTFLSISPHPTNQFYSEKNNPFENKINLKFILPIYFSSNKDTYMFLQPQFHQQNYPLEVINGSVNNDRIELAINTLIEIPKEQTEYYLKAGTVLCYLWFDNNKIVLEKNNKLKCLEPKKFYGNLNNNE